MVVHENTDLKNFVRPLMEPSGKNLVDGVIKNSFGLDYDIYQSEEHNSSKSNEIHQSEEHNNSENDHEEDDDKLTSSYINFVKELESLGVTAGSIPVWKFNEFQLEYLDEGFYGMVYTAKHLKTDCTYVLKELVPFQVHEEQIKLFYDEIALLSKLKHQNVIKCVGITWNTEKYICHLSEYIDGGSLFRLMSLQKELLLLWDTYLNIALDLARGMGYLHDKGIIHRDLTSKNILVRQLSPKRYEAIIIDFGLSYQKPDEDTPEHVVPSGPAGCTFYVAPELFKMGECSRKTDVFSYGIIICEIVSNEPGIAASEFPRNNDFGIDMEEFSEMAQDCPEELLNLAVRCCQVEAKLRPEFRDIVKMIDIILDNYVEERDINGNEPISPSDVLRITTDDFFIDGALMCSCTPSKKLRRRSQTFTEDICNMQFKTVTNRFGGVARAGSRKLLSKIPHRCHICGGRILSMKDTDIEYFNSNRTCSLPCGIDCIEDNKGLDLSAQIRKHVQSNKNVQFKASTSIDEQAADVSSKRDIFLDINLNNNECTAEEGYVREAVGPRSPAVVITKCSPVRSPELSNEDEEEKRSYVAELPSSPRKNKLFTVGPPEANNMSYASGPLPGPTEHSPAAVLLKQNKQYLSSKTSLLSHNTPGRLPRFFQQMLKRRKYRLTLTGSVDERRYSGLKSSWHKLFHRSTSGANLSPMNTSTFDIHDECHFVSPVKRRNRKNEINDYVDRRKSMPVAMKSWFSKSHHSGSPAGVSTLPRNFQVDLRYCVSEGGSTQTLQTTPQKQNNLEKKRSRSFIDVVFRRGKGSFQ